MTKTVVFDVGNVLWRYRPVYNRVFRQWAKLMGLSLYQFRHQYYEKNKLYRKFEKNTLNLTDWLRYLDPSRHPSEYTRILDIVFSDEELIDQHINHQVISLTQKIRSSGLPVGCLSNSENFFYPYFKRYFLPLFDYTVLSWQVGLRKPEADIYRQIYKHGKFLPSEIIFIDDTPANVAAAAKQGINAYLYRGYHELNRFLQLSF